MCHFVYLSSTQDTWVAAPCWPLWIMLPRTGVQTSLWDSAFNYCGISAQKWNWWVTWPFYCSSFDELLRHRPFLLLGWHELVTPPPPASPRTVKAAVGLTRLRHSPDPSALPPRAGTPPTESSRGPSAQGQTNWVKGLEQAQLRWRGLMASEVTQTLQWAGIQHPITLIWQTIKAEEIKDLMPNPLQNKRRVCVSKRIPSFTSHYFPVHVPPTNLSACHFQNISFLPTSDSPGAQGQDLARKVFCLAQDFWKYLILNVFVGRGAAFCSDPGPVAAHVPLWGHPPSPTYAAWAADTSVSRPRPLLPIQALLPTCPHLLRGQPTSLPDSFPILQTISYHFSVFFWHSDHSTPSAFTELIWGSVSLLHTFLIRPTHGKYREIRFTVLLIWVSPPAQSHVPWTFRYPVNVKVN